MEEEDAAGSQGRKFPRYTAAKKWLTILKVNRKTGRQHGRYANEKEKFLSNERCKYRKAESEQRRRMTASEKLSRVLSTEGRGRRGGGGTGELQTRGVGEGCRDKGMGKGNRANTDRQIEYRY